MLSSVSPPHELSEPDVALGAFSKISIQSFL